MVIGVFGLPGMGKTSFLTCCAQKNLAGRSFMGLPIHKCVFTNFECAGCYKLDFNKLGIYHFEDSLILIDEIMLLADARDFKSFPEHLKYFFSHSRHFNCSVVYCSQVWSDADKRIRGVTDHLFLISASTFLPVSYIKPIIRHFDVSQGNIFDGYTLGAPITWRFVWRPRWYKYYDSFNQRSLKPLVELEQWSFDDLPPLPPTLFQRLRGVFVRHQDGSYDQSEDGSHDQSEDSSHDQSEHGSHDQSEDGSHDQSERWNL